MWDRMYSMRHSYGGNCASDMSMKTKHFDKSGQDNCPCGTIYTKNSRPKGSHEGLISGSSQLFLHYQFLFMSCLKWSSKRKDKTAVK